MKINKVIMFVSRKSLLKLSHIFSKLMFHHQFTSQKQFNCIVKRCTADSVILIFH